MPTADLRVQKVSESFNREALRQMKGSGPKFIKLVSAPSDDSVQSGGRPRRICYVDDSRTSAYVTKKILTEFGYHVDHFPSAEPAIVALLESDYDLLLTDLLLSTGGMDLTHAMIAPRSDALRWE